MLCQITYITLWSSQFERHEIFHVYKHIEHRFKTLSRPMWGWILDHLTNPELVRQFEWDAQQVQRYDGREFIPTYTEPWTGRRWWEIQVHSNALLPGGILIFF